MPGTAAARRLSAHVPSGPASNPAGLSPARCPLTCPPLLPPIARLPACSAKTPLANFATGITILVTLLWITPVFTNMSQNVQGAIIIVGVLQLFDW